MSKSWFVAVLISTLSIRSTTSSADKCTSSATRLKAEIYQTTKSVSEEEPPAGHITWTRDTVYIGISMTIGWTFIGDHGNPNSLIQSTLFFGNVFGGFVYFCCQSCGGTCTFVICNLTILDCSINNSYTYSVSPKWQDSHCARHRKPWYHLSNEEQLLFVNGYQTLKKIGVLDVFIESHRTENITEIGVHNSSQNFYWHAYWLWELEGAFRELGADYECFALPYWDVTVDGELWLRNEGGVGELGREPEIDDLPIYNSYLGGDGDIDNDMCVGGLWSTDYYVTDKLCADDEEADNCCLKRLHITSNDSRLFSRTDFGEATYSTKYETFSDFMYRIQDMHGDIHRFIGSVPYTHFYASDGSSNASMPRADPGAEPLFILFHTFLDYARLLHADCFEFDKVALDDLDQYIPYSFEVINDVDLDYEMDFHQLCQQNDSEIKTFCAEHTVSPRLTYDMSINTQWNVIYELGGFWNENTRLMTECADNLNDSWWSNTLTQQQDESRLVLLVNDKEIMHLNFLSSMTVTAVFLMLILTVYALIRMMRSFGSDSQSAYQCVV